MIRVTRWYGDFRGMAISAGSERDQKQGGIN